MTYPKETIAELVHETLRIWSRMRGHSRFPSWVDAEDWMRASTLESVEHVLLNPNADPGAQHEQWAAQKKRDGWIWGKVKDASTKTHPMLVPFDDLPVDEQVKDALLIAIVNALDTEG